MSLLWRNIAYRVLTAASFFNRFGAAIYNLVFVVFASLMPQPELAISIANVIVFVPSLFSIFIGIKADRTRDKMKWLLTFGFLQALIFLFIGVLSMSKTWLVFSFVCLLNIISDMMSDYRGGLQMPIFQHNIAEDDLMEAYSFNQVISFVCMLGGQSFGLWLLSLSNQQFGLVAVLNALCFFLSSLLLFVYRRRLSYPEVADADQSESLGTSFREIFKNLEQVFTQDNQAGLLSILGIVLLINALGGALVAMYNIYFLSRPFSGLSYSSSIFLVQAMMMGGMMLGSLTPNDRLAKASLTTLMKGGSLLLALIGLFNLLGLPHWLAMICLALLFYLSGKLNPKISSLLMATVPSDRLAQTNSCLMVLSIAAMPLGTALFSALVVWNTWISWLVFMLLSALAFMLLMFTKKKESSDVS